jgi:hypothetical protein
LDRFGFQEFRVTFLPPNRVSFFGTDVKGRVSLGAETGAGGRLGANGLTVETRAAPDQGVILRFSLAA